jgi:hypothetical protein
VQNFYFILYGINWFMATNNLAPEDLNALNSNAVFGFFPQLNRYRRGDPRDALNLPVDVTRGRFAGTMGTPTDIANLVRSPSPMEMFGDVSYEPPAQLPYTTEYFLKELPMAPTSRLGQVAGQAGGMAPLTPAEILRSLQLTRQGLMAGGRMVGEELANRMMSGRSTIPGVPEAFAPSPIKFAMDPSVKASTAREAEVTRANRRSNTSGQYVGAPPGVDSPQKLGAMVNDYMKGMMEGLPGRSFYTDSSADIFARTGQNINESDLLAQNIAILSRANNVGGNTSMSAKAHIQAATGDPIKTGRFPSKDSPPLQEMYNARMAEYLGHKRDPFATQLGVEYAPERIGRGVNDMHEAELMGYPSGKVGGATQHAFMDEVRARAIAKANEIKLGGFSDWNTGNAQAAAWTGNKIRRGDLSPGDAAKSYATYFPLHEANATYEAVSSPVTGHLQGLLDAPFDARLRYTADPLGTWNTSASGRDIGYTAAGMLPGQTAETVGRFKNSANPAFVARPVVGTETMADGQRVMTPGSARGMTAVEAARAYFDVQEAGAWHKLMPAKSADNYSGARINFGKPFSQSDMEKVAPLFEKKGYYLASAPEGITVMANDGTPAGKLFADDVRSILKGNKETFKDAKVDFGALKSNYIDYGDAYKSGVPGSVTNELMKHLEAAPKTAAMLEGNQLYRNTVLRRNERDAMAAKAGYGVSRADVMRAREIFAKYGWQGLKDAAKAGTVPAVFMSVNSDNSLGRD